MVSAEGATRKRCAKVIHTGRETIPKRFQRWWASLLDPWASAVLQPDYARGFVAATRL